MVSLAVLDKNLPVHVRRRADSLPEPSLCVAGGSVTETFSNAGEPRLLFWLWKAEHHVEFERGKMPPPCLLAEQTSWLLSSWESLRRPSRQPGQGAAGRVTDHSWEKASVLPLPWAAHGPVMLAGE